MNQTILEKKPILIIIIQQSSKLMDIPAVPIVDLAPYLIPGGNTQETSKMIREICKGIGFFYVKNHGVPEQLEKSILNNSKEFFNLAQDQKDEIKIELSGRAWRGYFSMGQELTNGRKDLKQGFYFCGEHDEENPKVKKGTPLHGRNQFPKQVPALKTDVLRWIDEMRRLGDVLMEAIAESLGLEKSYFKKNLCKDHFQLMHILHYPYFQTVEQGSWAVGEHCDYGLVAMIMSEEKGLQVKNVEGEWVTVDPLPGCFVVNLGDMLQKLTKGLYKSTPHRVSNTIGRSRYSIPYFYEPDFDAKICELDIEVSEQQIEQMGKNKLYKRMDDNIMQHMKGKFEDYYIHKYSQIFPKKFQAIFHKQ